MMGILLYSQESILKERLNLTIKEMVPDKDIEVHRTFEDLSIKLHRPTYDPVAAILLIPNRQELVKILFLREWFQDIRIILILPDRDPDTISMGHSLFPRFVSCLDSDFAYVEVSAVLKKMFNKNEGRRRKTNSQRDGPITC